jgi:ectoine hydroxylase-related dioxygenase (phytanoyl-CoA dioxygenase family)
MNLPSNDSLSKTGFAIIRELVSSEIVDELTNEIEKFATRSATAPHALRHLIREIPSIAMILERTSIHQIVQDVLGKKGFVVRSLFFNKTPGNNWKVAWHQDTTIAVRKKINVPGFGPWSTKEGVLHTQPPSSILERMLTVRLHLDDCGAENGALRVLRGSHASGRLSAGEIQAWRDRVEETVCVTGRGDALLMRPLLLHASSPSRVPLARRVIHLEFAAETLPGGLEWASDTDRIH